MFVIYPTHAPLDHYFGLLVAIFNTVGMYPSYIDL